MLSKAKCIFLNSLNYGPKIHYYRPQRSCGQGNVFTGVCLSTGGRVSASVHAGMPYPPRTRQTPPGPGRRPRPGRHRRPPGVIIGKTLPLNFLPGVYPLKNFANKTLPGVSEINFFNQMRNPPPSWENPPHRYCDVILHCLKILKIDQSSQALQRNLLALHCFTIEHL